MQGPCEGPQQRLTSQQLCHEACQCRVEREALWAQIIRGHRPLPQALLKMG